MSIHQRQRMLASMLAKDGLNDLRGMEILDVGCGGGGIFLWLMAWGASPKSLHGIDRQSERVRLAQRVHPDLKVVEGNAASLPWPNERFDVVTQFTTFTSIPDAAVRMRVAEEVNRVLKPGGRLLWYDFWINPLNRTTHPLRAKEVRRLFPAYKIQLRRTTLAPPIARALAPRSQFLATLLQEVWVFQSHLVGVLTKV